MLMGIAILILVISGIGLLVASVIKKENISKKSAGLFSCAVLGISICIIMFATWSTQINMTVLSFLGEYKISFCQDGISRLFLTVSSLVWIIVAIYSIEYMEHEKEVCRFYGFFLLVYAVLICLDSAGNLITFYFFYELMTLTSLPLVMHEKTKEAIMGGLKYLFYSMAGAYLALFGIYFLSQNTRSLDFIPGGTLNPGALSGKWGAVLLLGIFFMIIGFGAKAGMFPLHAWLWAAHPVAPAPASAALSGIIVKGGVLALIRTIFYIVGAENLRGTWVWYTWMILSLLTVFMGSMLAFREQNFKKRLAYSTVSQASYIIFGLSVLNPTAFTGALLHFVFHAVIKCALFLSAGIFIIRTGLREANDYKLIGKSNPLALWGYTIVSLGLIGIPPTSGFISKWYLATGALKLEQGGIAVVGPVVLLISALLTAGYLLPLVWNGFFSHDKDAKSSIRVYPEWKSPMVYCVLILAVITVLLGMFPNAVVNYMAGIAVELFGGL